MLTLAEGRKKKVAKKLYLELLPIFLLFENFDVKRTFNNFQDYFQLKVLHLNLKSCILFVTYNNDIQ